MGLGSHGHFTQASDQFLEMEKASFWSTISTMRRFGAALLIAVLCFALVGPDIFAGSADRKLPACCRINGKHHCALAKAEGGSSGPAFQPGRCPMFGGEQAMAPLPTGAVTKLSAGIFGPPLSHPTPHPQTSALGRVAFDRSGHKRGPPSLS